MSESKPESKPSEEKASPAADASKTPANASPSVKSSEQKTGGDDKSNQKNNGDKRERRGQGPRPRRDRDEREGDGMAEKVVFINRCAKVVKGGRRFSFSALVVVGDGETKVGIGFGKANEVAESIKKASGDARRHLISFKRDGSTIPHEIIGEHGGGRVLLRPASEGTGIIAGGGMRAVLEVSGLTDVLAKNMGSNNYGNVVKATVTALQNLRSRDEIYSARGKKQAEKKAL